MARASAALAKVKYWVARPLGAKTYWYLMGRWKPVQAVTSPYRSVEDCLASGGEIVALLERLGAFGPDSVTLHIGSGLGRVEYHLQSRVQRCYGVDISPSMVKRARQLVPHDNVEFRTSDGIGLSGWPDGFFDLIYSFLVFQHLPRARFNAYVVDAYTKLAPGGRFVFHMMIDEAASAPDPPPDHPYAVRVYRRRDVEDRLREVGFDEILRTDLRGRRDDGSSVADDIVFCARKAQ